MWNSSTPRAAIPLMDVRQMISPFEPILEFAVFCIRLSAADSPAALLLRGVVISLRAA